MKLSKLLYITPLSIVALVGCNNGVSYEVEGSFTSKDVNFYRSIEKDGDNITPIADRQITLRFYDDNPHVPYIGVKKYYEEFYNYTPIVRQDGQYFIYTIYGTGLISLDTYSDVMTISDLTALSFHRDFITNNSEIFLQVDSRTGTYQRPLTINLRSYNIPIFQDANEAYVPFTLISNLASGTNLFNIAYNEMDLYEIDYQGQLSNNVSRTYEYYGDKYFEKIYSSEARPQDLAYFTYNLLCLEIDNFRGYTTQMKFIDNNILSLGLNGTLEAHYPIIKRLMLSTNRSEYQAGLFSLFSGLSDGGHTLLLEAYGVIGHNDVRSVITQDDQLKELLASFLASTMVSKDREIKNARKQAFGDDIGEFYYHKDDTYKTAYIGFDSFVTDFSKWDEYYKNINNENKESLIPVDTDSFAYVRSKLYQALEDNMENVVIDIASNGGGSSSALNGLVGLLNGAKATFTTNNVSEQYRASTTYNVDINLDGKYDDLDKIEADKFKSLNIVILTSSYAFSCGNLFPSLLKELGYKTFGEKTGGGSCAIMFENTGDGFLYVRSSYLCLSDQSGHNIDEGVEVDEYLVEKVYNETFETYFDSYERFFDVEHVTSLIKGE